MNRYKIASVIFLVVSLFIFSCSENSPTEPEETIFDVQGESGFVGTVTGTNAFIALLVAGDEAIVYVCNGDEEIFEWFRGAIADPTDISLTNSDGAQISGKFSGSSFAGNVTLRNASTHSFTASPNTGNETGVFRVHGDLATQEGVVAGWIVNSGGENRGALRVRGGFRSTPSFLARSFRFGGFAFPVERFFLRRFGSVSIVSMNG